MRNSSDYDNEISQSQTLQCHHEDSNIKKLHVNNNKIKSNQPTHTHSIPRQDTCKPREVTKSCNKNYVAQMPLPWAIG